MNELIKAKRQVFKFLRYRCRSEQEIRLYLVRKKTNPQIVEQIISSFKKSSLINDKQFTELWMEDRILRGYGRIKIKQELYNKGIDDILIDKFLGKYNLQYWQERIKELINTKYSKFRKINSVKEKYKLYNCLLRRGFSQEEIKIVLEE